MLKDLRVLKDRSLHSTFQEYKGRKQREDNKETKKEGSEKWENLNSKSRRLMRTGRNVNQHIPVQRQTDTKNLMCFRLSSWLCLMLIYVVKRSQGDYLSIIKDLLVVL